MGGGQSRHQPPAPAPVEPRRLPPLTSSSKFHRRLSRKYSYIDDQFQTLEQVTESLIRAGLESSNLVLGIDFTKSNEWTGKHSFNGRSLHAIGSDPNPYEQAIAIIGQTLAKFDEDNLIPCFGFGDSTTHDQYVFNFYQDQRPCQGFEEALRRYREIVPNLRLAGPTSFAPIIEAAMGIVDESRGQYHVLVIVADGQVTRSVETGRGRLSPQEQATIDAIVAASDYPLSIILVGVGDGPWDMMKEFDDNIPSRAFDNFQFVNFHEIMARNSAPDQKAARFALSALMEVPSQYKATQELGLLGRETDGRQKMHPLPPPQTVLQADFQVQTYGGLSFTDGSSMSRGVPYPYPGVPDYLNLAPHQYPTTPPGAPDYFNSGSYQHPTTPPWKYEPPREMNSEQQMKCPICLTEKRDLAFGCGHQTCQECGRNLSTCPICRTKITTRIRLY